MGAATGSLIGLAIGARKVHHVDARGPTIGVTAGSDRAGAMLSWAF